MFRLYEKLKTWWFNKNHTPQKRLALKYRTICACIRLCVDDSVFRALEKEIPDFIFSCRGVIKTERLAQWETHLWSLWDHRYCMVKSLKAQIGEEIEWLIENSERPYLTN